MLVGQTGTAIVDGTFCVQGPGHFSPPRLSRRPGESGGQSAINAVSSNAAIPRGGKTAVEREHLGSITRHGEAVVPLQAPEFGVSVR